MTTNYSSSSSLFHVLVIGDLIIDEYIYGKASRISPEAPVPVLMKEKSSIFLGGAANVAVNLAAHRCKVTLISQVSNAQKTLIQSKWSSYGELITTALLESFVQCAAPHKTRFYSEGQCMLRVDQEHSLDIISRYDEDILYSVTKCLSELLPKTKFDALVISDYCKGMVSTKLLKFLVGIARKQGFPLFIDTKKKSIDSLDSNCTLKPNLNELNDIVVAHGLKPIALADLNLPSDSYACCIDALSCISSATGAGHIVVTTGPLGAVYYNNASGSVEPHLTSPCEVADVSGAGDTFFAAYIQSWLESRSPAISCQMANYFAGCAVRVNGTYIPSQVDIFRYLRRTGRVAAAVWFKDLPVLMAQYFSSGLRENYSIGFTNGCFDVLHPGHMRYLQEARDACDFLICGLNSDSSVRLLKGPTRPVLDEQYRAQALLALESVDLVVIFDDPDPEQVIRLIKPDVLVKGGDYAVDEIIGAPFVASYGGRIFTIPFITGFSSTRIIDSFSRD